MFLLASANQFVTVFCEFKVPFYQKLCRHDEGTILYVLPRLCGCAELCLGSR